MRELTHDVADFTQDELSMMASNGVTGDEVREFIRTSSPQCLDTVIGGINAIRSGQGQDRNEPFAEQAAVEGHTETDGVTSHAVGEIAQAEDLISPPATET